VAVLLGGFSSERPVSLSSGKACADELEKEGYQVTRVDVGRDVGSVLAELKPDVAFNALHGPFGEDGTIQGILEYLGIPYTHSGVLASALAMNKEQAKRVAKAVGIPVAESKVASRFAIQNKHPMKPPYVVKPVNEGSSFGVVIVHEGQSHPPQVLGSSEWKYGDTVMVERYIHGRELTCAVMGDVALGSARSSRPAIPSTTMIQNMSPGDQSTNAPQKFHRIFTKKYKHWRSRLTKRSAVGAFPGRTSVMTIIGWIPNERFLKWPLSFGSRSTPCLQAGRMTADSLLAVPEIARPRPGTVVWLIC
jgi:hypothetical protein